MAGIADVGLRVSKQDFLDRIQICGEKMDALMDVIERYNVAKGNLDQFIQSDDITYTLMIERIDEHVRAAKKSHAALQQTKLSLEETVSNMETMGNEAKETLESAVGAIGSTINAALQIEDVL